MTVAAAPAPGGGVPEIFAKALANPYVGAGGAAFLFMTAVLVLIALMGDPKAGTPVVRISLAKVAAMAAPPGWREALIADHPGGATLSTDIFRLSATPIGPDGALGGQAVITLPG
ncbi:MAG: divergent polysaccharide deacetylase family protein, partial [Brevundimonas sp.]